MTYYQGYSRIPFTDDAIREFIRHEKRAPNGMTELAIWLFERKYKRPPAETHVNAGAILCGPINGQ